MKKLAINIITCILVVTAGCKSTQKTAKAATTHSGKQVGTAQTVPPAQNNSVLSSVDESHPDSAKKKEKYRFIVQFYSIGEGIDLKARADFDNFLKNYPKKVTAEQVHWGREGEVDYCLKLQELSTAEQVEFIKKTHQLLDNSKLVHFSENAVCVYKK